VRPKRSSRTCSGSSTAPPPDPTRDAERSTFAFNDRAHHADMAPITPRLGGRIGSRDVNPLPCIVEPGARAAEAATPHLRRPLEAGDGQAGR
jgi:hypothetical protein